MRIVSTIHTNHASHIMCRDIEATVDKKSDDEDPEAPMLHHDTSSPHFTSPDTGTPSLPQSEAEKRLIKPHDNVVGGGSMAYM